MNIISEINKAAFEAVKALYGQDVPEKMVQVQKTKKEFEGSTRSWFSHSSRFQRKSLKTQRLKSENG